MIFLHAISQEFLSSYCRWNAFRICRLASGKSRPDVGESVQELQPAVNRQPGFRRGGLVEQDVEPPNQNRSDRNKAKAHLESQCLAPRNSYLMHSLINETRFDPIVEGLSKHPPSAPHCLSVETHAHTRTHTHTHTRTHTHTQAFRK